MSNMTTTTYSSIYYLHKCFIRLGSIFEASNTFRMWHGRFCSLYAYDTASARGNERETRKIVVHLLCVCVADECENRKFTRSMCVHASFSFIYNIFQEINKKRSYQYEHNRTYSRVRKHIHTHTQPNFYGC